MSLLLDTDFGSSGCASAKCCWVWSSGCVPWCVRYADGGGLTAGGCRCRESVRVQVAELFEQKFKPLEVARRLRVGPKSACKWYRLWREGGVRALASRGLSGSRCRLSVRCVEKLAVYLEGAGPRTAGWRTGCGAP
ncbi:helix-turn-helix domain-containing protein [Streptomyces sioyaensis]